MFNHGKIKELSKAYVISRNEEKITIENSDYFISSKYKPEYKIFTLNVKNIPAFNKALLGVFITSDGGLYYEYIEDYGDRIAIGMNTERHSASMMSITNSKDPANPEYIEIIFTTDQIDWNNRVPTDEMTWLMNNLQKIYDEWKKEK